MEVNKVLKKSVAFSLILALCFTLMAVFATTEVQAASKTHLKKSTVTITVGKTYSQKLLTASGKVISSSKVTWKSSNKSIATVSSKGVIKAKKAGKATIKAIYNKKTYTCKCIVEDDILERLEIISMATDTSVKYLNKSVKYLRSWEISSSIRAASIAADELDVAIEKCSTYSELATLKRLLKSERNTLRNMVERASNQSDSAAYNTLYSGLSSSLDTAQSIADEMEEILIWYLE